MLSCNDIGAGGKLKSKAEAWAITTCDYSPSDVIKSVVLACQRAHLPAGNTTLNMPLNGAIRGKDQGMTNAMVAVRCDERACGALRYAGRIDGAVWRERAL